LAFSMTISATCTWRWAGSSKVELTRPRPHRALHVGDLFGPLVDEQHDEVDLGVVVHDGVGDVLQQHRLAGARRRDDQRALALADGAEQVDDAGRVVLRGVGTRGCSRPRVERRQVVEEDLVARDLGRLEVDRLDLEQREVALVVLRGADLCPLMVSPVRRLKRRICEGET
jgi:hypothetical protein